MPEKYLLVNMYTIFSSGGVPLEDIVGHLHSQIKVDEVVRFNIIRHNVLDGAARAMKRPNFSPEKRLDIKFTDDLGSSEGAVDLGGPKREFFRLCLQDLKDFSGMFEGPSDAKLLVCNAEGEIYPFPKILTIKYHYTFHQLKVNVFFFHLFFLVNVLFLFLCTCSYEK